MAAVEAAVRRKLNEDLSLARHEQVQSIRLIAAAAIAAAGQVRDTRLDQLESPPETPKPDLLFDVLVELAFSVGLTKVASIVIEKLGASIVASRVGERAGLSKRPTRVTGFSSRNAVRPKEARIPTAGGEEWLRSFNGPSSAISGVALGQLKKAALKAAAPKKTGSTGAPQSLGQTGDDTTSEADTRPAGERVPPAQDSPASSVEESALQRCAAQEATIGIVMDAHQRAINEADLTVADADDWGRFIQQMLATPLVTPAEAKKLRLFFESCIWGLSYPHIAEEIKVPVRTPVERTVHETRMEPRRKLLISEQLATYLLRRLPHPKGNGLKTFVEYDYRQADGGGISAPLSSRFAQRLATLPWVNQFEEKLGTDLFVNPAALHALASYFDQMTHEYNDVVDKFNQLEPQVYPTSQPRRLGPNPDGSTIDSRPANTASRTGSGPR